MIYTVTMNPAIDCSVRVQALRQGRVNRADSQSLRFGGKGINVSLVLKMFGAESVLTGFAAGFTGDALAAGLTAEGMVCDFVRLSEGMTRVNVKLTGSTEGDPDTEINAHGPAPSADELRSLEEKLSRLCAGDTVVLAGSLPAGVSCEYVKNIADKIPDGVHLVCDLSGDALRTALSAIPDFVKPNIHELFELMGIPVTAETIADRRLIEECAERLVAMGAASALITMGEGGAYFITHDGSGFVNTPAIPQGIKAMPSAVGCGDSAVAGWLMGMGYAGEDVRDAALEITGAASAPELAVILGSASYFMGFPPSPEKFRHFMGT